MLLFTHFFLAALTAQYSKCAAYNVGRGPPIPIPALMEGNAEVSLLHFLRSPYQSRNTLWINGLELSLQINLRDFTASDVDAHVARRGSAFSQAILRFTLQLRSATVVLEEISSHLAVYFQVLVRLTSGATSPPSQAVE